AADYINQKQLISLIDDTAEPLYQNSDAELFAVLVFVNPLYIKLSEQMPSERLSDGIFSGCAF
ncbi:hypothetical protein, partial [Neisseria meningitidis]|uniref:hypothetical protein n=1 Tax=Neisseria meningitidis TaxID=487 RepID=UPI00053BD002